MIDISTWAIEEKNKVSSGNPWVHLLAVTFPQTASPFRITSSIHGDITYDGHIYYARPLVVGEIQDDLDQLPQCTIQIANVDRVPESYLLDYAYYTKVTGIRTVMIEIMVVNYANLTNLVPETSHVFEMQDSDANETWATLTAGVASPFRKRFPPYVISKNQCQYPFFAGKECGYSGAATSCDRSLDQCRTYGNSARFGGAPGTGDDLYRGTA